MDNKYIIPTAIIIAGLLIGAGLFYTRSFCSETSGEVLSKEEVAGNALEYVNKNILRGVVAATLGELAEENGLYKMEIIVQDQKINFYATKDGVLFFPEGINLKEAALVVEQTGITLGDFGVSNDNVCEENDKPLVYFFGSESCPYCNWEHPIIQGVAESFGGEIVFKDNMGTKNDMDIFQKYSTGGIPTLVLGCKYYRVGSGEVDGEEVEKNNLTALICKLTGEKPSDVCEGVKDLINQIEL